MRLPMLTPRLLASGFLAATLSVGSANGFAKDTGVIYVAHGVGEDITIVATSSMVQVALGAAELLEKIGLSAEVIDPRTMWPLDEKALVESVKKTSRAIVVDEGYGRYGVTGELASVIAEGAFYNLEAPVKRMGAMHVPIPFSPPLEDVTVPTEQTVFEVARALCGKA